MKYVEGISIAMNQALSEQDNTIIIGQGVTDFKAIFGTLETKSEHPDRIIETPISKRVYSVLCRCRFKWGIPNKHPHTRADFSLLAFNQIINLAAKYNICSVGSFPFLC